MLDVPVPLRTVVAQWLRLGAVGFGGPPAHVALLRELCVERRGWLSEADFEDGVAATALLPGPASTQLAVLCAWHVAGVAGALIGGLCFVLPGLVLLLGLAAVLLGDTPPLLLAGAAAGAGAAVPAVAVHAARALLPGSRARATSPLRWGLWLLLGAVAAVAAGPLLVLVLLGCGLAELSAPRRPHRARGVLPLPLLALPAGPEGGLAALAWTALKVGALSYGGGFVIVPLMQADAVDRHGWMTEGEFLSAVALGQLTPGPVVQTVAAVGYAAAGIGGALLAAAAAFGPSLVVVPLLGRRLAALRGSVAAETFLRGAGPAALGAIAGSAVPLALALSSPWQVGVLACAAVLLLRLGVVPTLLCAAGLGLLAAAGGLPVWTGQG